MTVASEGQTKEGKEGRKKEKSNWDARKETKEEITTPNRKLETRKTRSGSLTEGKEEQRKEGKEGRQKEGNNGDGIKKRRKKRRKHNCKPERKREERDE